MPFFSVIIPLYNKEQFISQTINSVLNQTFVDYEIIIVNDGSTDKSLNIIQSIEDKRIKIINQKNLGASVARNNGFNHAKSEFYCLLDGDDYWKKNHLEVLYKLIKSYPLAGLYASRYLIKYSDNFIKKINYDFSEDYQGYINNFFKSSYKNRIANCSTVCIPKKTLKDIGGFDPLLNSGEDLDLWIRIATKYPVAITNKITSVYNYTKQNNNISKNNIKKLTICNLEKFKDEEKINSSLRDFLDLYRLEYALHFHIYGDNITKTEYLNNMKNKNLNYRMKILLKSPPYILRNLLYLKRFLKSKGIDFSVYH